jgi:hypothetical protein
VRPQEGADVDFDRPAECIAVKRPQTAIERRHDDVSPRWYRPFAKNYAIACDRDGWRVCFA